MKPPEPKDIVSFDEFGFIDENGIPVLAKFIELRLERGRVVKETTYYERRNSG